MTGSKSDHITPANLNDFGELLGKKIVDDITDVIRDFAGHIDERFNKNEATIFKIENRLDAIEHGVADIKHGINALTTTIDGFVKRLNDVEIDNTARDAQFRRLLDWAQKVSKKTGIPLQY